jgi:uncharacterized repeat protein (TIGR03803 family)
MCTSGGVYDGGTLFVFDAMTGVCTKVHDFNPVSDGYKPYSTLMRASNGKIYGTTTRGGTYDSGVLFEYDPDADVYLLIHEFTSFREYPWFSALIEVDTDFGINDRNPSDLQFSVYPNPVKDQLSIFCEQISGELQISILDVHGKIILGESYSILNSDNFTTTIKLGEMKAGIYFIRIVNEKGNVFTSRFVKTK